MLNEKIMPVFLGLMTFAAIAWLFLSKRLFSLLEKKYPEVYDSLGSPSPLKKRIFSSKHGVLKLLFTNQYLHINDEELHRLCGGMKAIFFIFAFCLAGALLLLV